MLEASDVRYMDAVVDRLTVGRKHEKAIKAGIAATLLVGDGLMQVHVVKGASKAEADRFYKTPVQRDASLRLRGHRSRVLRLQQPRERLPDVRWAWRRQAHTSRTPDPGSEAQHPRRVLRSRGLQV